MQRHCYTDHMTGMRTLDRVITTPLLALYGIGNIVGVGIYVLIGQIAVEAGYLAVLSFIVAGAVAFCAALSYAELATRFPVSAGISVYLQQAFKSPFISTVVGLLLVGVGIVSTATLLRGFSGYLHMLTPISPVIVCFVLMTILTLLAVLGIKQSVMAAALLTILEIGGLLFLIGSILWQQPSVMPHFSHQFMLAAHEGGWAAASGILAASFIAFYAFVGFEDTVNIAEEVRHPQHAYPKALFIAMSVVAGLYILLAIVVLGAVPLSQLATSQAPLALAYEVATGNTADIIIGISLIGTVNGMIVTTTMGSRFLYGLARQGWISRWFSWLSKRRVPTRGLLIVAIGALLCALTIPIERSAQITSLLLLLVFLAANVSLIVIRRQSHSSEQNLTPTYVPWLGALTSAVLLIGQLIVMVCGLD